MKEERVDWDQIDRPLGFAFLSGEGGIFEIGGLFVEYIHFIIIHF